MTATIPPTDRIEALAWADILKSAPARTASDLEISVEEANDMTLLGARAVNHPLINRGIGIAATSSAVERAASHLQHNAAPSYFLHLPAACRDVPELEQSLTRAGVARYSRAWVKLERGAEPLPQPSAELSPEIRIRPATQADALPAARLFCVAFDLPSSCEPLFASIVGRPRWDVLVADVGTAVVGVGMLFLHENYGYLAGGATAGSFRGRGIQGALVQQRVQRALSAGATHLFSETGEAVPGDPQHSFRNLQRAGFNPTQVRDNYAPSHLVWRHGRR